jgi:hypothetical protein
MVLKPCPWKTTTNKPPAPASAAKHCWCWKNYANSATAIIAKGTRTAPMIDATTIAKTLAIAISLIAVIMCAFLLTGFDF